MEWLKDKKNLPIVVAMAVFVMLAAGGLIAFELGAFSGNTTATIGPQTTLPPSSLPPGSNLPPGVSALPQAGGYPGQVSGSPRGVPALPAAAGTAIAVKKSDVVNPLVGPDPFKIPGGAQKIAAQRLAIAGLKPQLRDEIGPLNLFQIHPSAPPLPPTIVSTGSSSGQSPTPNYRLSGVITGSDGINAIIEVGGQSQSVKPGDSLPDGTQIQNIQATSVTLRTAGGAVVNLPLSAGAPDQGTTNYNGPPQFQNGFNGPPQFNQPGE